MHLSVRDDIGKTDEQRAERITRLNNAFASYAASNPLPSHGKAQLLIESFASKEPFTKDGDFRGFYGRPNDHTSEWWLRGIEVVMEELRKEDPSRGVVFFTENGSSVSIMALEEAA